MHPSPRPKKVDLTDVINSAYARNAQSHVDLTQDDDEIPPSQVLSGTLISTYKQALFLKSCSPCTENFGDRYLWTRDNWFET